MVPCCPKWSQWMASFAVLAAVFVGGSWYGARHLAVRPAANLDWSNVLPAAFTPDTAASTKNMSVATGRIEEFVEGLYVLDHLTGNLNVYVLNVRSGQLGASYRANILQDFGAQGGGEASYAMVTGNFDFSNLRQGQDRYANSICYVIDSNTGRIVGYTFAYSNTLISRGELQTGDLVKVVDWTAREQGVIRD